VDKEGKGGALALLWKIEMLHEIQHYSRNFFNVIMKEDVTNQERYLVRF